MKHDYSSFSDSRNELSVVIDIYNMITGSTENYSKQIEKLNKEVVKLNESHKSVDQIQSQQTGYFVSYADGYEDKLNTKNAASMSEDEIKKIISNKPQAQQNVVGKIFDSYTCKIVGVVNEDKRITEGASLKMTLSSSNKVYDIAVESVKEASEDGKLVVVLSCDRLDDSLVNSRVQSAKIVFDEYQGIKVPRQAIRFQGEQKGVYVLLGNEVAFKKIDVIYENENEDFVISKNTSDEDYLLLYDQILLEVVLDKNVSDSSESS